MKNKLIVCGLLGLFCLTLASCASKTDGQKLVQVEIQVDDKIAFTGKQGVSDKLSSEKIWESIVHTQLEATTDYSATLDPASQTHAVKGKVVVKLRHVNRELGISKLDSLTLKREPPSSWKLADGEMELVKQAAEQDDQTK